MVNRVDLTVFGDCSFYFEDTQDGRWSSRVVEVGLARVLSENLVNHLLQRSVARRRFDVPLASEASCSV